MLHSQSRAVNHVMGGCLYAPQSPCHRPAHHGPDGTSQRGWCFWETPNRPFLVAQSCAPFVLEHQVETCCCPGLWRCLLVNGMRVRC